MCIQALQDMEKLLLVYSPLQVVEWDLLPTAYMIDAC